MMRILIYIVEVAVLVAVAVWLANRPGVVLLEWQGYRIETSIGILALVVFLFAAVCAALYATWRWVRRRPREWSQRRQMSRQDSGLQALADGLVAIAAGDVDSARKQTRRAGSLLEHAPMTLLLEAQTAQLAGDETAARECFENMLKIPETEFLGLRGLITDALRVNDDSRALGYARRAYALKPGTPWVLDTMISLHSRAGDWREAQRLVEESQKAKRKSGSSGNRQQAALLTERARVARQAGQLADAYSQARKANDLDPHLVPAAELVARMVAEDGRARRARKVLERSWAVVPHPALMDAYLEFGVESKAPLDRYKAVETIVKPVREHPESRLALAEAALNAKLWGEARVQLEALELARPSLRVFQLRARLAEEDSEDLTTPEMWLERAATADSDPQWVCGDCGTVADDWTAVCGHCGAFATLDWNQPPRIHRAVMASRDSLPNETPAVEIDSA
ncbi:MAG: tetratricopeptide repeat protein [Alphaproteobacteria bacterium]|nr:tetratricopeptide repeat protein [Alphaproteobacteria bacterium]